MSVLRRWLAPALIATALLAGCSTAPMKPSSQPAPGPSGPTPGQDGFPSPAAIPPNLASIPNAVPRPEPRSTSGNPPSYEVFGKVYRVRNSAKGYDQTGYASWYGRKFQGRPTASGEPYDMFKMTAAHKTLPIPSFAKVTNLANDRSVVVRINDRGPFHRGRIIDLSYAAALKLGMLRHGSTKVRVQALVPKASSQQTASLGPVTTAADPPTAAAPSPDPPRAVRSKTGLFLQVGVFRDARHAEALQSRLQRQGFDPVLILRGEHDHQPARRVLIGPFATAQARQNARQNLQSEQLASDPVDR